MKERWLFWKWNCALALLQIAMMRDDLERAQHWQDEADKRKAAFDAHTRG